MPRSNGNIHWARISTVHGVISRLVWWWVIFEGFCSETLGRNSLMSKIAGYAFGLATSLLTDDSGVFFGRSVRSNDKPCRSDLYKNPGTGIFFHFNSFMLSRLLLRRTMSTETTRQQNKVDNYSIHGNSVEEVNESPPLFLVF